MADAAEWFQKSRGGLIGPPQDIAIPTDLVKVKNLTGANRAAGEVVELGDILTSALDRRALWFEGNAPSPAAAKSYAILKEDIPTNKIGLAQVSGICVAEVDVTDADHHFVVVNSSDYNLQSAPYGSRILYQPAGTGTLSCAVVLPLTWLQTRFEGITAEAIAANGSGDVTLILDESTSTYTVEANYDHIVILAEIPEGARVTVEFFFDRWQWVIADHGC